MTANSGLLAFHTRSGGRRTFRLPETVDSVDLASPRLRRAGGVDGKVVARGADEFTVELPSRSTAIYRLER